MLKNTRFFRKSLSVVLALVLALLAVSVAYAAFITVNTDNGSVDTSAWSLNPTFVTDADTDTACLLGAGEIITTYVGISGTISTDEFFFRGEGTGFNAGVGGMGVALMDCNSNSVFTEDGDRQVVYDIDSDTVTVTNGSGVYVNSYDTTFGELIGTTDAEFRATVSDLGTCASGDINVRFEVRVSDPPNPDFTCDSTVARGFRSPTAITQSRLTAQSTTNTPTALLLGLCVLALGALALVWRRAHRAVS